MSPSCTAEQHRPTPSGSRTSRLEEDQRDFEEDSETQSSLLPLKATFSLQNSRRRYQFVDDEGKPWTIGDLLSLISPQLSLTVGVFMGLVLLFLLVMSLTRPAVLHRYIGSNTTLSPGSDGTHFENHTDGLLSYENYTGFPLQPYDYLRECAKLHKAYMQHGDYWDRNGQMAHLDVQHTDDPSICSRTITYMLDGTVGLTADLAIMAQAAALARERNRTFLVDDTFWNRGKWTDHFEDVRRGQPGPQPSCRPPPANACRLSTHCQTLGGDFQSPSIDSHNSGLKIINSRTANFHFGHGFSNHYEDPYAHELNRLKPIFESAQFSFTTLIIPNAENKALIEMARQKLSSVRNDAHPKFGDTSGFVSVHIRRGDRKTLSYLFPDRKIPISDYINSITSTWTRLHGIDALPVVYLATDSPAAHQELSERFGGIVVSLYDVDEPRLRAIASPGEYYQQQFDTLDLQQRKLATRGMVVDLALSTGLWPGNEKLKPDALVCGLSSNVCRLAPIGLGWDVAFSYVDPMGNIDRQHHRWIEIDQKGQVLPEWEAFELFY